MAKLDRNSGDGTSDERMSEWIHSKCDDDRSGVRREPRYDSPLRKSDWRVRQYFATRWLTPKARSLIRQSQFGLFD